MWTTVPPLRLLRYLIVLRVNSAVARLAPFPAANFSATLGQIIAERLPSQEAKAWRRALLPWEGWEEEIEAGRGEPTRTPREMPSAAGWPIDAILRVYPGKQIYGFGERILWEIKLLGDSADHNLFLELLLPAIEAASLTADPRWTQGNSLWGRFEIDQLSVARGALWQPLARQGRIDLRLRPDPLQWADGLPFHPVGSGYVCKVSWQTPYAPAGDALHPARSPARSGGPAHQPPSLTHLWEACTRQIESYLPGWLSAGQRPAMEQMAAAVQETRLVRHWLTPPPYHWPGQWMGEQLFSPIPGSAVPYLALGALLHIGQYRHLGCGAFVLEPSR